ncbi:MAG: transposase [Chryseobacterium sp.]|jgi:hypothetical protein|uniref:transposase n=1 Tax=Chryseobacterium sp. TaxID=1871047 RepID=UPI002826A118|nr:transposase [Chryseobacterium sp.]MDR2238336.1 transposase [Chryseobacterium sp.]
MNNLKNIHVGHMIEKEVKKRHIEMSRICNFIACTEIELMNMYQSKSLDADILLRWSKILEYDLFRIYSQHLILYAPIVGAERKIRKRKSSTLPQFRKSIYTQEIIDFILEQFRSGMTITQIMERYGIPRATIHGWIYKY